MGSIFLVMMMSFSSPDAGILYVGEMYVHVHSLPSIYSSSLTVIGCGHPVEIMDMPREKRKLTGKWNHVRTSGQKGYVLKSLLVKKHPSCFQDRYPRFLSELDLGMAEIHYWGRLYDLYVRGKSKVGR